MAYIDGNAERGSVPWVRYVQDWASSSVECSGIEKKDFISFCFVIFFLNLD